MSEVDAKDDAIERWLVLKFRYDPDRRERRDIVVAAFDSDNEGHHRFIELRLENRDAALSQQHLPAGYTAAQRRRRAESPLKGFKKARVRKRGG